MLIRTIALALLAALPATADTFAVKTDESVFAIVTQRGGIAARLAHDHLIAAAEYDVSIAVEDGKVSRFEFTCEAAELLVDNPDVKERWSHRVTNAKLVESAFKAIKEDDRSSIRESMLGDEQLDAAQFPEIKANVTVVREQATEFRGVEYTHTAELEFTVHGQTVTRGIAARIGLDDEALTIEAAGAFRFTEFGIEPYSAMLGAVKNQDDFLVYCYIAAARED